MCLFFHKNYMWVTDVYLLLSVMLFLKKWIVPAFSTLKNICLDFCDFIWILSGPNELKTSVLPKCSHLFLFFSGLTFFSLFFTTVFLIANGAWLFYVLWRNTDIKIFGSVSNICWSTSISMKKLTNYILSFHFNINIFFPLFQWHFL